MGIFNPPSPPRGAKNMMTFKPPLGGLGVKNWIGKQIKNSIKVNRIKYEEN
jgi:hypothetical protein